MGYDRNRVLEGGILREGVHLAAPLQFRTSQLGSRQPIGLAISSAHIWVSYVYILDREDL